jgi:ribosome maturation factor RimP
VDEEAVMRDESRHAASRPGRAGKRDGRGGQARRDRGDGGEPRQAVGPAPDAAELAGLLEPVISAAGMDLEGVRVAAAGRRRLLRVVVDADGGVGLDDMADLSREISACLDSRGAMGETPYTLEVTSPGVDRPLTEPRHWRRARGRLVSAPLAEPAVTGDSARQTTGAGRPPAVTGRVLVAGDAGVTLEVDGEPRRFTYAELGPGRVQVEFARAATHDHDEGWEPVASTARSGDGGGPDGY